MVSEIDLNLCSSDTYNMRPPYSPMRFGVSMVTLQPASTDLNDLEKENLSSGEMSNCHFLASIPQLTNIRMKTSQKLHLCQLFFMCSHLCDRSGWWLICLYKIGRASC